MELLKEPSEYFVFCKPLGILQQGERKFSSITSNPYEVNDNSKSAYPFVEKVTPYELRYFFELNSDTSYTEPELAEFGNYWDYWIYSYKEMTELDVIQSFIYRAFEYFEDNKLEEFLEYQYSKYPNDPERWLCYVEQIFKKINNYTGNLRNQLSLLRISKLANEWLNAKSKELAELSREIIDQLPTVEEKDDTKRTKLKFNTKKGNKSAFYYVLRQLYEKKIIESSWPEIAAFLIENVTGFENVDAGKLAGELSRKSEPMLHRKIDIPTNLAELDE
jgi:hypothetical protein